MKFTLAWLKDHLDTSATLEEITFALTDLGLEVESVTNPAERRVCRSSAVASRLGTKPLVMPLGLWIVGTVRHPGLAFAFVERMRDRDRLAIG